MSYNQRLRRKVRAGDRSVYPFNDAFTDQERRVFSLLDQLRATLEDLKGELARTPMHAHRPPENYDPAEMEEITEIADGIDAIDRQLRWIPGGVYRHDEAS
jgi:hypothetical protein